jgi:Cytochrome b5-like Heme/Steroid binding domain
LLNAHKSYYLQVYDVTPYLDDHPGGADVLIAATGTIYYLFCLPPPCHHHLLENKQGLDPKRIIVLSLHEVLIFFLFGTAKKNNCLVEGRSVVSITDQKYRNSLIHR